MTPIDPLLIAALVAATLEKLRIPYVIGGSVASSLVGEPRSTLDIDVMIDATEDDVRRLVADLREAFYVDEDDAIEAIREMRSFNVIHFDSSMKVDFFPAEPLGKEQISRRRVLTVRPDLPALCFYSAEDLIVRKLLWYRAAGTSARQWRDVVSILKISHGNLDEKALMASARQERVDDLLLKAVADAGIDLGEL